MKIKDKKIIEQYLILKIKSVECDLQLADMKKSFYQACARNAVKNGENNRIVNLSETKFCGKINIREAFTRQQWKYNRKIQKLQNELNILKKAYEKNHTPEIKSKRVWATDVYKPNMRTRLLFTNKVIHKGKSYAKESIRKGNQRKVAGNPKT